MKRFLDPERPDKIIAPFIIVCTVMLVVTVLVVAALAWRRGPDVVPAGNQITSETAGARLAEAKGLLRNAERAEARWRQARDLAEAWKKAEKAWAEAKRLAEEWEEGGDDGR